MQSVLQAIACFFKGHNFQTVETTRLGYTTAPFPAVDEWVAVQRCDRCGKRRQRYAGFIMSNDPEARD